MMGGQAKKVMLLPIVLKIWETLLSPFRQVDKRQLQHEIDTYRLFLLTSYNRLGGSGEELAKELQASADSKPFTTLQDEVQSNVHQQISAVSQMLDGILLKDGKIGEPLIKPRPSGLSFAVGHALPQVEREKVVKTNNLDRVEVAEKFYEHFGYTLLTKRSDINHVEAGEGLFLRGRAEPGVVVAFYPGVIYAPSQYRYLPGYPRVDRGNPYLISRFDGLILDGKSWGRGGDQREWWEGGNSHEFDPPELSSDASEAGDRREQMWESVTGAKKLDVPVEGSLLERRNPLAFGHFANHPPKGRKPNVMICPYSVPIGDDSVRPYVPNVILRLKEEQMERRGLLWIKEGRSEDDENGSQIRHEIRTLVLVATRVLENEELLLNYRLSAYMRRPQWYFPVDEEEDRRRWE
ncbi:hypothetical protein R1flu_012922 [Riccia fluitans]|uniref:SET domain-containing protein n=1 Tax=Riccia fluitans TaxID=41844 RepID=A0ABD1ZD27_9MARC